jgi:hypothetical protein
VQVLRGGSVVVMALLGGNGTIAVWASEEGPARLEFMRRRVLAAPAGAGDISCVLSM